MEHLGILYVLYIYIYRHKGVCFMNLYDISADPLTGECVREAVTPMHTSVLRVM